MKIVLCILLISHVLYGHCFELYQSTGYRYAAGKRVSFEEYGFVNLTIIYERSLWSNGEVKDKFDLKVLDRYLKGYKTSAELVVLDVEHYKMKGDNVFLNDFTIAFSRA